MTKKTEAFKAFEELTRKLLDVPKTELAEQMDEYNKRKEARKVKRNPKKRK
jgi:hypothetical protein